MSSQSRPPFSLPPAGELSIEEERGLEASAEEVRCRWCGSTAEVEVIPAPWAAAGTEPAER